MSSRNLTNNGPAPSSGSIRSLTPTQSDDAAPAPRSKRSHFRLPLRRTRPKPTDLEAGVDATSELTAPPPVAMASGAGSGGRRIPRRFTGQEAPQMQLGRDNRRDAPDDVERRMANWMTGGKERRKRSSGSNKGKEEKFLCCFPPVKSPEARKHVMRCFMSGIFTTLLLAVFLGLTVSHKYDDRQFSVLLIMMMLGSTIVFCHSLTRACFLILRPQKEQTRGTLYNVNGYAMPQAPIPVILARDEENQGREEQTAKLSPPAYGLWRSSVRVDPNAMYWQQNPNARMPERPATGVARPPSYVSEDGVSYVVDAVPRSTVPTEEALPVHPSERGRAGQPDRN